MVKNIKFLRENSGSVYKETLSKLQKIYNTIAGCIKKYGVVDSEVEISNMYDRDRSDFEYMVEEPIEELNSIIFKYKRSYGYTSVYYCYSDIFGDCYYDDVGALFSEALSCYTGYTNIQLYGETPEEVIDEFPDNLEDVAESVEYAIQSGIIEDIKTTFKEMKEANDIIADYNSMTYWSKSKIK